MPVVTLTSSQMNTTGSHTYWLPYTTTSTANTMPVDLTAWADNLYYTTYYGTFDAWMSNGFGNWVSQITPRPPVSEATKLRRRRAQEIINRRAEELLRDLIGDGRYRVYRERGHVIVSSRMQAGRLAYQIRPRQRIRVLERQPQGGWQVRPDELCIHPRQTHPEADEVAALVLMARYDEPGLWKTANIHRGVGLAA